MNKFNTLLHRYTYPAPNTVFDNENTIYFEIKPYLQPFEKTLAIKELTTILNVDENKLKIFENYFCINSNIDENLLSSKLTYWQRIGRNNLYPTKQTLLELTQSGKECFEATSLHKTRRLRYGPHDIHEYRGKFFPQLVKSLINIANIKDNSCILDPMCGSGTTLCEANANGMNALGADLNPLSVLISRVKCEILSLDPQNFKKSILNSINKDYTKLSSSLNNIWSEDDLNYLKKWFDIKALEDIASIIKIISNVRNKVYQDFLKVNLSNILRAISWQKNSDLRVRKEIKEYLPGTAIDMFKQLVTSQVDKIYPYLIFNKNHNQNFVDIVHGDSINIDSIFKNYLNRIDLIITSPPYATALPYLDTDRLSLIVLGLLSRKMHHSIENDMIGTREISEKERVKLLDIHKARKNELPESINRIIERIAEHNNSENVGFRKRNLPALLSKYFLSMLDAMRACSRLLNKNCLAFYIVGNNSTMIGNERLVIPTDEFFAELGECAGLKFCNRTNMELLVSRDIFRENRGSSESILCFQA